VLAVAVKRRWEVSPSTGTGSSTRMGMRKPFRWEWIGQPPRLRPIALRNAKGYGTTRLGTYYPPKDGCDTGRFFNDVSGPHIDALFAAVAFVNGESIDPAITVVAENACGLCGRKLEDPISITCGIGPECASKPTGSVIAKMPGRFMNTTP
jgi:hypothetical protein